MSREKAKTWLAESIKERQEGSTKFNYFWKAKEGHYARAQLTRGNGTR
jgi:viroplasmin and RNaseH domain-containing protein